MEKDRHLPCHPPKAWPAASRYRLTRQRRTRRRYCPYCRHAKALLNDKGINNWTEYDLEIMPEKFGEMVARSNGGHTVPQIFVNGAHIGGSAELVSLELAGQLDSLLQTKTVA